MTRPTYREEHLRVMTEVRALAYETIEVDRARGERAIGIGATAHALRELCSYGVAPEELLGEQVSGGVLQLREFVADTTDERHRIAIEQGERTRPYDLPHPELIGLADIAASNAYLAYSRSSGIRQDMSRQGPGSCSPLFYLMQHELRKLGVETQHMWWFEAGNNHHFLRTMMPNGDVMYMDPTWQQYLPEGTDYSEHPNVLIMPEDRREEILLFHGIPESWHRSWLRAKIDPRPEQDWWDWSRELKRVFDEDPWIPSLPLEQQRFYVAEE